MATAQATQLLGPHQSRRLIVSDAATSQAGFIVVHLRVDRAACLCMAPETPLQKDLCVPYSQ